MVATTLVGTDDDLGDTVASYVFDVRLARGLLITAGAVFTACAVASVLMSTPLFPWSGVVFSMLMVALIGSALAAAWGVLIGASRLRRSDDRFVVHRLGLAHHQGQHIARVRWVDIAAVHQIGPRQASRLALWNGSAYRCHVERRDGASTTFDNYVVDAVGLGGEIERRSLL